LWVGGGPSPEQKKKTFPPRGGVAKEGKGMVKNEIRKPCKCLLKGGEKHCHESSVNRKEAKDQ